MNLQKGPFNDIAIILKPNETRKISSSVQNLVRWLYNRKKNIYFLETEFDRIKKYIPKEVKTVFFVKAAKIKKCDLCITLGGDGTLIGQARTMAKSSPPIFGVNLGRLGFITEFNKSEYVDELGRIFQEKKAPLRKLNLYSVEVQRTDETKLKGIFFNDAVLNKNHISRIFSLDVDIDEEYVYSLSGDGLIVSSAIGSTAYSLAAGGPIILPSANGMALTPICPHSLTHRPMVIDEKSSIRIKIKDDISKLMLTLDGQEAIAIGPGDTITIQKRPNQYIRLVKNPSRSYFHTLREKFNYGKR